MSGGCDRTAILWDSMGLQQGQLNPIVSLDEHRECVTAVALNPINTNILATGDAIGLLRLWDWAGRDQIQETLFLRINELDWNMSGNQLAVVSDTGSIDVFNVSSNRTPTNIFHRQPYNEVPVNALAWAPSGDWLATGSEQSWIVVWNVRDSAATAYGFEGGHLLNGHTSSVISLSWFYDPAQNANWLVSLSADGEARVWDAITGERLAATRLGDAIQVRWSPISPFFASIHENGTIALWNFLAP